MWFDLSTSEPKKKDSKKFYIIAMTARPNDYKYVQVSSYLIATMSTNMNSTRCPYSIPECLDDFCEHSQVILVLHG